MVLNGSLYKNNVKFEGGLNDFLPLKHKNNVKTVKHGVAFRRVLINLKTKLFVVISMNSFTYNKIIRFVEINTRIV